MGGLSSLCVYKKNHKNLNSTKKTGLEMETLYKVQNYFKVCLCAS